MVERWCKRRISHHSIRHYKSRKRTQLLDQSIGVTARQYKDYPGKISHHLLRNCFVGVGFKNKALRRRPLALATDWSSRVFDTDRVQLFNWNAGNLSRNAKGDTLNDLLISPCHIETIQEASTYTSQPALMEARGIASASSRDGTIMINSGGAGYKMVRKTHSEEGHRNQFCDWIQRPAYYDQRAPQFDGDAAANSELDDREDRESYQEGIRTESLSEVILPLAEGHTMPSATAVGLDWEVQSSRRDNVEERMLSSEGIENSHVYQRSTERYQEGITKQGCCWYMVCHIACYNRTDHIDEPLTPPASDPEPDLPNVSSDDPPPLLESHSDDDSVGSPYDWLYDLGDGYRSKGRQVHARLPRPKRLANSFLEEVAVVKGKCKGNGQGQRQEERERKQRRASSRTFHLALTQSSPGCSTLLSRTSN